MDPSSAKNLFEQMIPFVKKTGVRVVELAPAKVVLELPHDASNLNPMGILHAGATFTLAETAAAAMCLMAFGQKVMFIGKQAEIRFRRPAKGDVKAVAELSPAEAERLLDAVAREGKIDAPVMVNVLDGAGEAVATSTVTMNLRKLG